MCIDMGVAEGGMEACHGVWQLTCLLVCAQVLQDGLHQLEEEGH